MQVFAVNVSQGRVSDDFRVRVQAAGTNVERHRAALNVNAIEAAGLAFPVATQGLGPR
jgi:hypothetical protein